MSLRALEVGPSSLASQVPTITTDLEPTVAMKPLWSRRQRAPARCSEGSIV